MQAKWAPCAESHLLLLVKAVAVSMTLPLEAFKSQLDHSRHANGRGLEGAKALLEDLQALPHLWEAVVEQPPNCFKTLPNFNGVTEETLYDFSGPQGCRVAVNYGVLHWGVPGQIRAGHVRLPLDPAGLASCLRSVQITFGYFQGRNIPSKVALGHFANCDVLESAVLDLTKEGQILGDLFVCGLDKLPATCCSVVLRKGNDGLPFVVPAPGWQAFQGSSEIEIELRRV